MAPRANWKGYLRLSLVTCPIALYPAVTAAERVSFRQVNRQTGNRLRQQLVDTVTGEIVQRHEKGRGYEIGERQYLVLKDDEQEATREEARSRPFSAPPVTTRSEPEPEEEEGEVEPRSRAAASQKRPEPPRHEEAEELKARAVAPSPVRVEDNRTIEIDRFVPSEQIDARYHDTPYYIAPRDDVGLEAFAVIRDAIRGKGLVGMGRVVLSKRERPIMLQPMGNGLLGVTLRYAHEVRNDVDYFGAIPDFALPKEMLKLAEHIITTKAEDFDPAYLEDRYRTALVELLQTKKSEQLPAPERAAKLSPQNVINLMDALRRSLGSETREIQKPTPVKSTKAKRVDGQREMLLPISGKGGDKGTKKPARTTSRTSKGRARA